MSVPKNKRKDSGFETQHDLIKLRKEVTKLAMNNFGFSRVRYEERIKKLELQLQNSKKKELKINEMRAKCNACTNWFINSERNAVIELMRNIVKEFSIANSIYPYGETLLEEYKERRIHLDLAIGYCYSLNHELEYIFETLPVDINKFKRFEEMLEKQIGYFKGIRKADRRFLKGIDIDEKSIIS